jgi:succinate dehydrogenase/fumarate reductase flavoprotein subunit
MEMDTLLTEVLVVGSGGGGAMAAVHAAEKSAKVLLVTKGEIAKSGATPMAVGTMAGVGTWHAPGDDKNLHILDTIKGGCYLNEQELARIMVNEAPHRIVELERRGAYWDRGEKGEKYLVRTEGGHSHPRGVFIESRVGAEIVRTLGSELCRLNVDILENLVVMKLSKSKGAFGAFCVNTQTSEFVFINCKSIVLATGGPGQLYLYNTQDIRNTGDGLVLALKAGAALIDMEFEQFYPWGYNASGSLGGLLACASYFSKLYNRHKTRFLNEYDPERLEMSTRDIVARAIYQEILEGRGTPNGGVICDTTHIQPGIIKETLPSLYDFFLKVGLDMETSLFEIVPTFHYLMGGIRVDEYWQTSCQGLFAVGETAAGVHGANRISQNSLADILVSGARAGEKAADYSSGVDILETKASEHKRLIEDSKILFSRTPKHPLRPHILKKNIQKLMWHSVGVIRNGKDLEKALDEIKRIESEDLPRMALASSNKICNRELIEFIEVSNLLLIAECVTLASLSREESRGAHFREDFKDIDNNSWLKHIVIKFDEERIVLDSCPIDSSVIGLQGLN